MTLEYLAVILIVFASTLVRSSFGFGDALIAMPMLSLFLSVEEVVAPLVACVSVTTSSMIMARDWRSVHFSSAGRLILAAVIGVPVGMLWLEQADERMIKLILAVMILLFSLYSLLRARPFELRTDRTIWFYGFTSGILGGAYNAFGPPLVIFGTLRQWSPERFRATIQGFALPMACFVVLGHFLRGFRQEAVFTSYLLSLPFLIGAVLMGRWVHGRFRSASFQRYIHYLLLLIGAMLLVQVLR